MYTGTEPAEGGLSQSAGRHMETPGPRGHGAGASTDAAGEKLPPATPPLSTGATKRSELEAEKLNTRFKDGKLDLGESKCRSGRISRATRQMRTHGCDR